MSSLATVRAIHAPHNGVGVFIPDEECRIPSGSRVVELKYCELCGRSFSRQASATVPREQKERDGNWGERFFGAAVTRIRRYDSGQRICFSCARSPLPDLRAEELLEQQNEYQEQLPDLSKLHLSSHPIKYDQSIAGRETNSHRVNEQPIVRRRKRANTSEWEQLIYDAFLVYGERTMEQLCDVLPGCYTPASVNQFCLYHRIPVKLVRYENPKNFRGRGHGVYALRAVQ